MAIEKMTQIKALKNAMTVVTDKETRDKLQEIVTAMEKKKAHKGASKTAKENVGIKETIYNTLATLGKAVTVTELQNADDGLKVLSNQKISALLKQMREENLVDCEKVGKSNKYFALIEGEDDDLDNEDEETEVEGE